MTRPHRVDPSDIHRRTIDNLLHKDWELGEHVWDVPRTRPPLPRRQHQDAASKVTGPERLDTVAQLVDLECEVDAERPGVWPCQ